MIVIKDGKHFNKIYADKAFDKWGEPIDTDIRIVENWHDIHIPTNATKIDANLPYQVDFTDYYNMIENTLWIFNNEPIKIKKEEIYMTGAGVNWMFQQGKVTIFDISRVQINFIKALLQNWNGEDYGSFVYQFIVKNKIIHFHLNLNETQMSDKFAIKDKNKFIQKINNNFEMLKNTYDKKWKWNPKFITVNYGNIIEQIPKYYLGKFHLTNVFDFKYYFAKLYTQNTYDLLSNSTKAFLKHHDNYSSTLKKLKLQVPVKEITEEIQKIKKYFYPHRGDIGVGWKGFCIHGQKYNRTKAKNYYLDFLGYNWTPEAIKNMPKTIKWLKTLDFKNFARVRVMCLNPKSFINLKNDQDQEELNAIHVSITNHKDCKFYLENEGILDFTPGTAYTINSKNYYTVINNSNVPRYHIIIHGDK